MRHVFLGLAVLILSACAKQYQMDTAIATNKPNIPDTGRYSYLALGDSYTIGESVELTSSFPYQLKAQLFTINGLSVKNPRIIAVTGWTTNDLITAIAQANLNQKYDFVTLLIGVNNQFQGLSQADYRTQFVQLLNTAIGFANNNKTRVFVVSIPDYSVTPFAQLYDKDKIATQIDQFNAINLDESTKAGVNHVNITDISRQAVTDPLLIAADGLHPSAKMYGLWVQRLEPIIAAQLKK